MSLIAAVFGRITGDGQMKESKSRPGSMYGTALAQVGFDGKGSWMMLMGFGQMAEKVAGLKAGEMFYAFGRPFLGTWKDRNGQVRPSMDLIVSDVAVLDPGMNEADVVEEESGPVQIPIEEAEAGADDDVPF